MHKTPPILIALLSPLLLLSARLPAAETPTAMELRLEEILLANADRHRGEEVSALKAIEAQAEDGSYLEHQQYWWMRCLVHGEAQELDAAREAGKQLLEAGTANNDKLGAALSTLCNGFIAALQDDYTQAFDKALEARAVINESGTTKFRFSAASLTGSFAARLGRHDEALAAYQEALRAAEALNDARRISNVYHRMAGLSADRKDIEQAVKYLHQAIDAASTLGLKSQMTGFRITEGNLLSEAGRLDESRKAYQDALKMARELGDIGSQALLLSNLCDVALRERNFPDAEKLARDALVLAEQSGSKDLLAFVKGNLAFALAGQKRIAEAEPLFKEAIAFYEASELLPDLSSLYEEWSRALADNGRFEAALQAFRTHSEYRWKIFRKESEESMLVMQQKLEGEKKEREIALLSKDNALKDAEIANRSLQQRIWVLVALLLTALAGVALLLYRRVRQANEQLAITNQELHFQSTRDALTSLFNRRYFQQLITTMDLRQPDRRGSNDASTRALYLVDIDHFKRINDKHGHAAGDTVLVEIARRLTAGLRDSDVVVRWGGEEFLVFAQQLQNDHVQPLATRILKLFSDVPVKLDDGHTIRVTASVGYSLLPLNMNGDLLGWERALNVVDMALYLAKAHGRNRAYGVTALHVAGESALASIEKDLESAWKSGAVDMQVTVGDNEAS